MQGKDRYEAVAHDILLAEMMGAGCAFTRHVLLKRQPKAEAHQVNRVTIIQSCEVVANFEAETKSFLEPPVDAPADIRAIR